MDDTEISDNYRFNTHAVFTAIYDWKRFPFQESLWITVGHVILQKVAKWELQKHLSIICTLNPNSWYNETKLHSFFLLENSRNNYLELSFPFT